MVMPYRLVGDGHIHTNGDHRGPRTIFLDGVEVKQVFYADTKAGKVIYCKTPLQVDETGEIISETRFGKVEVVFL